MQNFLNMIYIFGCGALGKTPDIQRCANISKIRDWALKQECWDVVYCALRPLIESGEVRIPEEIYLQLENIFTANIAKNIQKIEFSRQIIKKLEENGIRCCYLKGITISRFYHTPEARVSSDTDILINVKHARKAIKILREMGYETEKLNKKDHHIEATHPVGGLLEVHIAFHSVQTNEILLKKEFKYSEPWIMLEDGISTLGVNDGLMFLTGHLINHMISDCLGIRQIMDLLLYMKKYESEIDWENYNLMLDNLSYGKMIRVIKGIGVKYFGLEFEDAITEEKMIECLLEDMKIGGIFSLEEKNRRKFYHRFSEERCDKGKKAFFIYRYLNDEAGLINLIFPSVEYTSAHCPYVAKYPYLLPVAWVHRVFRILLGKKAKTVKQKEVNETEEMIARRMSMVRKLGMLGKE